MAAKDDSQLRGDRLDLATILAESARLKRQSAKLLQRAAELDEKIAEMLPGKGSSKPSTRRKR